PWLQNIRSESVTGLSSIVLLFEPGTDLPRARQLVQERLTQAQAIPSKKVAKAPVMLQPLSSSSRVTMIGLSSKELSLIDLSVLARWNIKPRLMGVPGVANVAVWGQRERQLQVQVDPEQLSAQGVSLDQVIETAGNALWVSPLTFLEASTPGSGGFIDTPNQRLGIRHVLPISMPKELAQVPIEGCIGTAPAQQASEGCTAARLPLRLGEVATIVEEHQPLIGDAVVNGGPGLLLVIEKFPNANTLEVTREIEEAFKALEPGLAGVEIDTSLLRPATFIERAVDNLGMALLVGFILLAFVLLAFFYSWRSSLVSLITVPLSLIAGLLVLHARGETLNTMVLAGLVIALGIIVDDAIVDIENIVRRLRQHRQEGSTKSTARIILEASLEVRNAIAYATLMLLLVTMPIFFIVGAWGAFFRPLALSYALAMLASMVVALTVTPALSLTLFRRVDGDSDSGVNREPPLVSRLGRAYEAGLSPLVTHSILSYSLAGVIVLAGVFALAQLRQGSLLPVLKETDLLIHWSSAPGTSRIAMAETAAQASHELRSVPGVSNVAAHVGRAITGDQVVSINTGEIWVNLDPQADHDATLVGIRETLDGYPELQGNILNYSQGITNEALSGTAEGLVVRVYGHELDILREKAAEVQRALAGVEGITGAQVEQQTEEPIVEVQAKLAAAERYGLKPGDVRRAATTLVNGIEVGNLFESQKVFDVMVVGTPEVRSDLSDIRNLLIDTPAGGHVRLAEVADVRVAPTPNVINREGASRRIDVQANVQGRDLSAVVGDVERALEEIDFPLEYHPEILGEYAELQSAQRNLMGFTVAAVVGIFLMLQASFRSWRLAVLAFLALPAALAGGVIAAYVGGGVISLGSLVGFLTVLGIAARNGIMLINHYQHLEQFEGESFGLGLVLRGAKERLAPILMTA
ncbi:MAG: Cobalt-zinc-cadmium resistance protein CzcA; Cation efflux system protein CusA, partial [uncultured Chloroflexia bacterium]